MSTEKTNHLFWHLATYNSGKMSPPYHQIIAIAGIEIKGETAKAWIVKSRDPSELVQRIDQAFSEAHHVTSFTGSNFGLPVLISNAFITNTVIDTTMQKLGSAIISHTDLAKELQHLVNPDGYMGFNLLCRLCGLPPRPDLDIAAAWRDPKTQKRIGKRLLIDVVLIALGYAKCQYISNTWDAAQTKPFSRLVVEVAAQKVKIVGKMFEEFLNDNKR